MEEITIEAGVMEGLSKSAIGEWDMENNLLGWDAQGTMAEELVALLNRCMKNWFVIREIYYEPDDNEEDYNEEIAFYMYRCRFTAWLDGWRGFERRVCSCYSTTRRRYKIF
jgi:hypothetical protein